MDSDIMCTNEHTDSSGTDYRRHKVKKQFSAELFNLQRGNIMDSLILQNKNIIHLNSFGLFSPKQMPVFNEHCHATSCRCLKLICDSWHQGD